MTGWLKNLLTSKKFQASALSALSFVLAAGLRKAGVEVPDEAVMGVAGSLLTYVVGQAVADHGKEAAIIKAKSDAVNAMADKK